MLHCEPIEKVADDAIGEFGLTAGEYDNVGEARYAVPERAPITDLKLYVKPEERVAYYVVNEKFNGSVSF